MRDAVEELGPRPRVRGRIDRGRAGPGLRDRGAAPGSRAPTSGRRCPPPSAASSPVDGGQRAAPTTYADAVQRVAPAVVNIYTARVVTERVTPSTLDELLRDAWPPRYRQRIENSLGSGVIVDHEGHIVTNHHVIANADAIRVQLADERIADASIVGRDPDTGPRRAAYQPREFACRAHRAVGPAAGRRRGAGDRQPRGPFANRHPRHRQRHHPLAGRRDLRKLHSDGRRHQRRQFRRRARGYHRRAGRHQHRRDRQEPGRRGHRLRHPRGPGARRDGRHHQERPRDPRLDRHRSRRRLGAAAPAAGAAAERGADPESVRRQSRATGRRATGRRADGDRRHSR